MRLPTTQESDAILAADAVVAGVTELPPMSTAEWRAEVAALRTANAALDAQLWAAKAQQEVLDTAANDRAWRLEGEATNWRIAALAMLAVWLVTMGGLWWW